MHEVLITRGGASVEMHPQSDYNAGKRRGELSPMIARGVVSEHKKLNEKRRASCYKYALSYLLSTVL